jgi:signal transduction histidine kinase
MTVTDVAADYRSAVGDVPHVLELLADVCRAPMAALKVAGDTQAHFAATWGIPATVDVPRPRSLCDMVSAAHDAVLVDDASRDPRVADHPLVSGAAHVNFIAAAPLHQDGRIVGALCVFDNQQRRIDDATTRRYLEGLARRVDSETGLRHLLLTRPMTDLVATDDIVATISHELRTPLASIQGYTEMLTATPGAVAEPHASKLDAIGRNVDRLARTVDTLLRAADQQRHEPLGRRRVVELATVAAGVVADLGAVGARISIEVSSRPVHVYADPRLLEVAIDHLLRNALGFSTPDQPVTVTVEDSPRPTIRIQDRGPGLDARELGRLGTPFFRGADARRRQAPGLGLGLAVTRRIVRAQGADLRLISTPGRGLTAQIAFA